METQVTLPAYTQEDSIESFGTSVAKEAVDDIQMTPKAKVTRKDAQSGVDHGLQCECGVSVCIYSSALLVAHLRILKIEDECTFCEGGCGRWFHIWYVHVIVSLF
jgi:hypothetical protein